MKYQVKELLDKGLDVALLSKNIQQSIQLIATLSENFSIEDETAKNLDKVTFQEIMQTSKHLIAPEPKPKTESVNQNLFIGDAFFKKYPEKILGKQTYGGRYGDSIIVTDGNINDIQVVITEKTFPDFTDIPLSTKSIEDISKEANTGHDQKILRENRSLKKKDKGTTEDEMRQYQSDNEVFSFREIYEKYNQNIERKELEAFLITHPDRPHEKYIDEFLYNKDQLIKEGYIFYNNGSLEYKWLYVSGNVNMKHKQLINNDKDFISFKYGEEVYENQLKTIIAAKPIKKNIDETVNRDDRIFIVPHSDFAKTFKVKRIYGYEKWIPEDQNSLFYIFKDVYLNFRNNLITQEDAGGISFNDIVAYYIENKEYPISVKQKDNPAEYEKERQQGIYMKQRTKEWGDKLFQKFLSENIYPEDKAGIEYLWNEKYNGIVIPDFSKIPVGFTFSSKFKNDVPLILSNTQVQGVRFFNISKSACLAYDVGVGKGHLLTSLILTPKGYVKMGDSKVGDEVIGKNGKPTILTGIFPLGKVQCYKVTFSDGSSTEVSDEHLWNVQTINYRNKYPEKWDTVVTKDIIDNLYNYRGDYQYSIPMVDTVEFTEQSLPIHPYLLGALLGDGGLSIGSIMFSNPEKDIIEKIKAFLPDTVELKNTGDDKDWRISRKATSGENPFLSELRKLGLVGTLSNTKFIPQNYLYNSAENRLELLRGLIDTDGYIKTDDVKKGCTVQFTTVSPQLRDGVKFLVQSFGGTCIIHEKLPHYTHNGESKTGQLAYTLSIRMPENIIPVSSEKHLKKFEPKTKYQPIRFIQSIEDIGFHEAQCIKVAAEDELYVCQDFIVTHNTLSCIASVAFSVENNICKYPIVCVPNNTYQKWIFETVGGWDESKGKFIKGALPHYKIRDLYNLNTQKVYELKNYSDQEQQDIDYVLTLIDMVKADEKNAKKATNPDIDIKYLGEETNKYAEQAKNIIAEIDELFSLKIAAIEKVREDEKMKIIEGRGYPFNFVETQKFEAETQLKVKEEMNKKPIIFYSKFKSYLSKTYEWLVFDTGVFPEIEEGTISFITYEGLRKLGIKDYDPYVRHVFNIVSQDDNYEDPRGAATLMEKLKMRVAGAMGNARVYMEDLQADMLVLDEGHKAKKVFTSCRGEKKSTSIINTSINKKKSKDSEEGREKTYYQLSSGTPSSVGLSTYILSSYIQKNNGGSNVLLLTATPFENSPLEVYSMLSLINHDYLVKNGFGKMKEFFDTFMRINYDLKITISGKPEKNIVLTGYQNLPQMRTLIRSIIDYVTGEQANINRPVKVVLPSESLGVRPIMALTTEQERYMKDIQSYIAGDVTEEELCGLIATDEDFQEDVFTLKDYTKEEREEFLTNASEAELVKVKDELTKAELIKYMYMDDDEADMEMEERKSRKSGQTEEIFLQSEEEKKGVRLVKAIGMMKRLTLSPYMYKCKQAVTKFPTPEQFVEESPKLVYVMECIKSVRNFHIENSSKMSGQVIYIAEGIKYFPLIKQYLVKHIGFANDEVELINSKVTMHKREQIKSDFLSGKIKIIIGSSSIMVGVDLQENTSVLYNLWYMWNPTDTSQVEGRCWRQGNRFNKVRIVFPMCENSADPITFQYLTEKTLRLKDIWDLDGVKSQFDLRDIDFGDAEFKLITDPVRKAEIEIMRQTDRLKDERNMISTRIKKMYELTHAKQTMMEDIDDVIFYVREYNKADYLYTQRIINTKFSEKYDPLAKQMEENNPEVLIVPIVKERDEKILELKLKMVSEKKVAEIKKLGTAIEALEKQYNAKIEKITKEKTELVEKIKANIEKHTVKRDLQLKENDTKFETRENRIGVSYASLDAPEFREFCAYLYREAGFMAKWANHDTTPENIDEPEFDNIRYKRSSIRRIMEGGDGLGGYRNHFDQWNRLRKQWLEKLSVSEDEIDNIITILNDKAREIEMQIETIDNTMTDLIKRFAKELAEDKEHWKTAKERAQEFADLNYMLNDYKVAAPEKEVTLQQASLKDDLYLQRLRLKLLTLALERFPEEESWVKPVIDKIHENIGDTIFAFGGNIDNIGCPDGCRVRGKRHSEGGEKFKMRGGGSMTPELEEGEVVITRNAVLDNEKKEFEGKMLTNKQILSEINQDGGGVAIN
jgi:hypothetical protein